MKLRYCYAEVDERVGAGQPPTLLSVSQYLGVVPRSTLTDDVPRADSFEKYKVCRPGDLVLNRFNAYRGSLGLADQNGMVSPDYLVLRPAVGWNSRFLDYLLRSDVMASVMKRGMGGIGGADPDASGFARIDVRDLGRHELAFVPSPDEQQAVADFLDRETAKIDALIAKQEQLITTLREDRTATITHAVTKGLNPDVETKPSGIGWLGMVPSHWSVRKLRHVGEPIIGLTYSPEEVLDGDDGGTLVLRSSNIQNGKLALADCVYVDAAIPNHLRVQVGDVLLCARNGSRALIGKNILIGEEVAGQTFGAFMTIFRSKYNGFLYWVFNSRLFDYQTATFLSSTINQLTTGNLKSMEVPFPPAHEQQQIADYLLESTGKVENLIARGDAMIQTLREYRAALITDAVTGKIDVRGVA